VDTHIARRVHAEPETIFELASKVEDWPSILPHYRWVRVLSDDGRGRRLVEMAARRDVLGRLGFPLHWTALETMRPAEHRIEFEHVRGITRGMSVAWTLVRAPGDAAVEVQIRHVFWPRWAVPDGLVRQVVGEYFVNGVAQRTLAIIARLAESRTKDA
jgi:ribosome-associated toxin RatA of RatAB toxin-antitoxin module